MNARRLIRVLFASILAPLGLQAGITPGSKTLGAIWFIGDSITQSKFDQDPNGSPRKSLYDMLLAQGYTFTYTGHWTVNEDGLPGTGDTPETNLYQYHSGISGSVIGSNSGSRTGMTQNMGIFLTSGRLASVKPDVVLLMLGTNDVNGSVSSGVAPARLTANLTTLLNTMYFYLNGVCNPTVFVATIPPNRTNLTTTPSTVTNTALFNAGIPGVASGQRGIGRDVHFVDQFTPLDNAFATTMVATGDLHPNAAGNTTMAQQWFNAIDAIAGSSGTPFGIWARSRISQIRPDADASVSGDPDGDGRSNLCEFAFNGDPLSGADSGQVHVLTSDSTFDADTTKEVLLTIAVRLGTPAFSGAPSPAATHDGITYTIEGSMSLSDFTATVNVVPTAVTTGLAPAGAGYEYRSFSLAGSNGLATKGFLRARVAQ